MSVTPQRRGAWATKLARLTKASTRAQEDVLVAVHEAVEAGLSQADIAHMLGGLSPSTIAAKAAKGRKIAEGRKRA